MAGWVLLAKSRSGRIGKCTKNQPLSPSPFFARIWTGVFLIGKTIIGRFANKKLLEHRPMIVFPIRSCARPEFVRARRGRGFFSTQRLQICADWVLSTQSSPAACAFGGWQEFGWLRLGSGFRYTEIADSWRLVCIYTEIADALVVAGLYFFLRASRGREGCMYMCIQ